MRYWINRRARELSLRFMYSLDVRYTDEPINPIDFRSNIMSFWSTNPINNYYMLKKLRIKKNNMIVIGCYSLKNNRIFLRIIDYDKFNKTISPLENKDKFKNFLRNYNLNEKTDYGDSDFYKTLKKFPVFL